MEISGPDVGMVTWTHRGVEVWRRAAGVATRRHGDLGPGCGNGDVDASRCGGLEARCSRVDVEV